MMFIDIYSKIDEKLTEQNFYSKNNEEKKLLVDKELENKELEI